MKLKLPNPLAWWRNRVELSEAMENARILNLIDRIDRATSASMVVVSDRDMHNPDVRSAMNRLDRREYVSRKAQRSKSGAPTAKSTIRANSGQIRSSEYNEDVVRYDGYGFPSTRLEDYQAISRTERDPVVDREIRMTGLGGEAVGAGASGDWDDQVPRPAYTSDFTPSSDSSTLCSSESSSSSSSDSSSSYSSDSSSSDSSTSSSCD